MARMISEYLLLRSAAHKFVGDLKDTGIGYAGLLVAVEEVMLEVMRRGVILKMTPRGTTELIDQAFERALERLAKETK